MDLAWRPIFKGTIIEMQREGDAPAEPKMWVHSPKFVPLGNQLADASHGPA